MIDEYAKAFQEEVYELLAELETSLLELEERPDDAELIGRVFRALHTIKGSGGMFGFDEIAAFTHEVETVFELVREGQITVTKDLVNLTLSARDQIKAMLDAFASGDSTDEAKAEEIVTLLRELAPATDELARAGSAMTPPLSIDAPSDPFADSVTYWIHFRPALDLFMNGTNPILLLDELGELGDCHVMAHTEAIPPLAEINPESCYTYWDVILTTGRRLTPLRTFLYLLRMTVS
jgi:two-component system chemotaxis sensor kinase CheA